MSNFNREHNLIFIHVPRTGGSSMEKKPFIDGTGHLPLTAYENEPGFNDAFKFAFVRNPLDRFVSAFFYHHSDWDRDRQTLDPFTSETIEIFNAFVMSFDHPEECRGPNEHYYPQWMMITDSDGNIGVDYLGKYEDLYLCWKEVCNRIGVPVESLGWERTVQRRPYTAYYTPESEARIRELYKKDFEMLGYE